MTRITITILLVLAATGAFVFGFLPAWDDMIAARSEIKKLVETNDELVEIAKIRDDLTGQYNSIPESDLSKLSGILPSGISTAKFLRDIEALAVKNGLFLKNLDFLRQDKTTAQVQLPSQQKLYASSAVSLTLRGSYEALRSFLKDFEKMARITDVSEISFTAQAGQSISEYALKGVIYYEQLGAKN